MPDKSKAALLIIDMISDFEFKDGEKIFGYALDAARRIAELKKKAAPQPGFRRFISITISANGVRNLKKQSTIVSKTKHAVEKSSSF